MISAVPVEMALLKGYGSLCALAMACLLSLLCVSAAGAQQEPPTGFVVYEVTQANLVDDSMPDRTEIRCNFAGGNDLVRVYDEGRDMRSSADWREATDFENDIWVFDAGADERAELVIVFSTDLNQHTARLYDDRDGDRWVRYTVRGREVVVEESPFWTVKVVADGPWYNGDGSINRNVTVSADGALGERSLDFAVVQDLMVHDGRTDLEMECHTGTWPSMSGYCLTRLLVSFRGSIPRTKLRVVMPGEPLPEIVGSVFWPHLGPGPIQPQSGHEIVPALRLNWRTARFDRAKGVNNLLLPDPPAQNAWWALSQAPVIKGQLTVLDFENPFSHYDLAADHDDSPALVIRHVYSPPDYVLYEPGERYLTAGDPRVTLQNVRYTWDQDNDGYWDYKLGLFGEGEVTTTVSFPDFEIISIPYDRLPWVVTDEQSWAGATFVQVESQAEESLEGVYDWDAIPALSPQFIAGIRDELNLGQSDIRATFRGEYRLRQFVSARLYLSPVDHKLHLFGAEAGVWNVDDALRVRYQDTDADGYFDQWQSTRRSPPQGPERVLADQSPFDEKAIEERPLKTLQLADGMLIYADSGQVRLVRTVVEPSLFETLPPRDHGEWLALGEQLDRYGADFAPDALLEMASQFQGPTTQIQGATLADFRLTEGGFRFVLKLQPGFQIIDDASRLAVDGLADGSYLVTFDGEFQVQPLTPPRLIVPRGAMTTEPPYPQQGDWATIRVVVQNIGLQDASSVPIAVYAAQGEEEPFLVGEEKLSVPGEGQSLLEFPWWPAEAGAWTLSVEVDPNHAVSSSYAMGPLADLAVRVEPASVLNMFRPAAPYDQVSFSRPVLTMLIAACAVSLSVLWLVVDQTRRTTDSGEGT